MSMFLFGIQPVIPMTRAGRTRILVNLAEIRANQFGWSAIGVSRSILLTVASAKIGRRKRAQVTFRLPE